MPSATRMACASSSTWKYSTEAQSVSWRIVVPLTNWRAQMSLPSTKTSWSGESSRSLCGMLSGHAPARMRGDVDPPLTYPADRLGDELPVSQRKDDVALHQAFDHSIAGRGQDVRA